MKPYNFSFVIPNLLAGMGHPGYFQELEENLQFLQSKGVCAIVSLTEENLDLPMLKKYHIDYLHLPIADFSAPSLEQIQEFVQFTNSHIQGKQGVAVHCHAGMGRTGTMLACYLVKIGHTPEESIHQIRNLRPGSLETLEQENSVFEYAAHREST